MTATCHIKCKKLRSLVKFKIGDKVRHNFIEIVNYILKLKKKTTLFVCYSGIVCLAMGEVMSQGVLCPARIWNVRLSEMIDWQVDNANYQLVIRPLQSQHTERPRLPLNLPLHSEKLTGCNNLLRPRSNATTMYVGRYTVYILLYHTSRVVSWPVRRRIDLGMPDP